MYKLYINNIARYQAYFILLLYKYKSKYKINKILISTNEIRILIIKL